MSTTKIFPFYAGTQFEDWRERNCVRCAKLSQETMTITDCQITDALVEAQFSDGSVPEDIAKRMGYLKFQDAGQFPHTWDCPERKDGQACRPLIQ